MRGIAERQSYAQAYQEIAGLDAPVSESRVVRVIKGARRKSPLACERRVITSYPPPPPRLGVHLPFFAIIPTAGSMFWAGRGRPFLEFSVCSHVRHNVHDLFSAWTIGFCARSAGASELAQGMAMELPPPPPPLPPQVP